MTAEALCFICHRSGAKLSAANYLTLLDRVECRTCGTYCIEEELRVHWKGEKRHARWHVLSGLTRWATEDKRMRTLRYGEIEALLASGEVPRDAFEKMARLVIYIGRRSDRFKERINLNRCNHYSLAFAHDQDEFDVFIRELMDTGDLEKVDTREGTYDVWLTSQGLKRYHELEHVVVRHDQAFVAMWADDSMKGTYEQGILPALHEMGFKVICENWSEHSDKIDDKIVGDIRKSGLLVVDLTGHRNSVYYEAGFADGLGTKIIYTCSKDEGEDTGFDIRQYKRIHWENATDLKDKLIQRIRAMGLNRGKQKEA